MMKTHFSALSMCKHCAKYYSVLIGIKSLSTEKLNNLFQVTQLNNSGTGGGMLAAPKN